MCQMRNYLHCLYTSFLYSNSGQYPNGVKRTDTIVGNDKTSDKPLQLMQSLRSSSLTSLNQLRMFEEKAVPKNVTAQIGHPVYLHCIVEPIGDKMVSLMIDTSLKCVFKS